jgi:hypothetical protein
MTTFYVGQRVRIKRAETIEGSFYVGKEAVVTEFYPHFDGDLYGLDICPMDSDMDSVWGWTPDQLEPLTDSYELVSWESMRDLWVPEQLRVAA